MMSRAVRRAARQNGWACGTLDRRDWRAGVALGGATRLIEYVHASPASAIVRDAAGRPRPQTTRGEVLARGQGRRLDPAAVERVWTSFAARL